MEDQTINETLKILQEKFGYYFKEEELSPELRKEIGLLTNRLKEIDQFSLNIKKLKSNMDNRALASFFLLFIGICFIVLYIVYKLSLIFTESQGFSSYLLFLLLLGAISSNLLLIIAGVLFFIWGYFTYLSYKHELKLFKENEATFKFVKEKWDSDLENFSKKNKKQEIN